MISDGVNGTYNFDYEGPLPEVVGLAKMAVIITNKALKEFMNGE